MPPIFVYEELPSAKAFGEVGRVWFGAPHGLKPYARRDLDSDAQAQLTHLVDAIRRESVAFFDFRRQTHGAVSSRAEFERRARAERTLNRTADSYRELATNAVELAERLAPTHAESAVGLADALTVKGKPVVTDRLPAPRR